MWHCEAWTRSWEWEGRRGSTRFSMGRIVWGRGRRPWQHAWRWSHNWRRWARTCCRPTQVRQISGTCTIRVPGSWWRNSRCHPGYEWTRTPGTLSPCAPAAQNNQHCSLHQERLQNNWERRSRTFMEVAHCYADIERHWVSKLVWEFWTSCHRAQGSPRIRHSTPVPNRSH